MKFPPACARRTVPILTDPATTRSHTARGKHGGSVVVKKKVLVTVAGVLALAGGLGATPSAAADYPVPVEAPVADPALFVAKPFPTYGIELGARYWFGWTD